MSLNRKAIVALALAAALSIGSFMLLANALQAPEHSVPSPIQMRKDAGEEGPREESKPQKNRKRRRDLPGTKQGQAPSGGGAQPAAPPPPPAVTGDDASDHRENDVSVNSDGESDDEESDDGESDDGESDDGESDDGESDDGESDDGESDD
jgi:hypothetical protein